MEYQGWSNYPTWCVHLWLTNDEPNYRLVCELVKQAKETDDPRGYLAQAIKEAIEEAQPLTDEANVYSDLMTSALGMVEYYEIARFLLED